MDIVDRILLELKDDRGAQKKFAKAVGISSSNVTNWKNDKLENKPVAIVNSANKLILCYIQNLYKTKKNFMQCVENSKSK